MLVAVHNMSLTRTYLRRQEQGSATFVSKAPLLESGMYLLHRARRDGRITTVVPILSFDVVDFILVSVDCVSEYRAYVITHIAL